MSWQHNYLKTKGKLQRLRLVLHHMPHQRGETALHLCMHKRQRFVFVTMNYLFRNSHSLLFNQAFFSDWFFSFAALCESLYARGVAEYLQSTPPPSPPPLPQNIWGALIFLSKNILANQVNLCMLAVFLTCVRQVIDTFALSNCWKVPPFFLLFPVFLSLWPEQIIKAEDDGRLLPLVLKWTIAA